MGWDCSGEEVVGEVENLEVGEVEKRGGDSAGEFVVVEVECTEEEAAGEGGGDGGVEVVGVEAELAEVREVGEGGGSELAGELEARQAELVDSVVETEYAAPVAGSEFG